MVRRIDESRIEIPANKKNKSTLAELDSKRGRWMLCLLLLRCSQLILPNPWTLCILCLPYSIGWLRGKGKNMTLPYYGWCSLKEDRSILIQLFWTSDFRFRLSYCRSYIQDFNQLDLKILHAATMMAPIIHPYRTLWKFSLSKDSLPLRAMPTSSWRHFCDQPKADFLESSLHRGPIRSQQQGHNQPDSK